MIPAGFGFSARGGDGTSLVVGLGVLVATWIAGGKVGFTNIGISAGAIVEEGLFSRLGKGVGV
jgi:hypothetical protein